MSDKTKIIVRANEPGTKLKSWFDPRTPNRGEPFELDHYEIYIANKIAKVKLFLEFKNKEIIIRNFEGLIDYVYSEVLKAIPDSRLEDFKKDWMNIKLDNFFDLVDKASWKRMPGVKKKPDIVVGNKAVEVKIKIDKDKKEIIDLGIFDYQNPNQILADKIRSSELDISEIAEKVGLHVSMVSKQMKGERDITREHAFAYAKFFGCDPADILFAAPQVPIWSTVDFLNFKENNLPFNPGECVSVQGQREYVVCPRDIYRPDVKAIKVKSPGSYLDGMILFYYATSDVKQDCLGRLSIIGDNDTGDDELMKELRFGETQRYFVGILEQYKGKTKLLNPDPYAIENKNSNNGIVINDVTPTFASPIVGIVNPNQIKKDRHSSKLFKVNDEVYKAQRQVEQMVAKQSDIIALQKMKLEEQSKKLQKEMEIKMLQASEELKKLQDQIKAQERKNLMSGIGSLFYPELKKGGLLNFEELKDKKKRA